jgi:hypothetical protein
VVDDEFLVQELDDEDDEVDTSAVDDGEASPSTGACPSSGPTTVSSVSAHAESPTNNTGTTINRPSGPQLVVLWSNLRLRRLPTSR